MKVKDLRKLIQEVMAEANESWPFLDDSEEVIQDTVDKFISGSQSAFTYLATRANNEEKLNIVLDMIKKRLKSEASRISTKNQKSFQSRFGLGGGQETPAGTYTGD